MPTPLKKEVDSDTALNWVDTTLAACMRRVNRHDFIRQLLRTLLVAVVAALFLQVSLRSYVVDGESMLPGLKSGDHLVVDQLTYRLSAPQRGDIVVFRFPQSWSHQDLVKRVIGLPGDLVEVQPHRVLVNGQQLNEPYVQNIEEYHYGPTRVPAGAYFVLGDNREVNGHEISYDSHQWGFLPAGFIYGKLMLTFWPLSDFRFYSL
jgi:signal peptidase I